MRNLYIHFFFFSVREFAKVDTATAVFFWWALSEMPWHSRCTASRITLFSISLQSFLANATIVINPRLLIFSQILSNLSFPCHSNFRCSICRWYWQRHEINDKQKSDVMFEALGTTSEAYCHRVITPFYVTDRRSLMSAHSLRVMITVPSRVMYWRVLKCEIFFLHRTCVIQGDFKSLDTQECVIGIC